MIPNRHRAQEFSLTIRYRPTGRHDQTKTPGFYMTAGFANEGEATYPVEDKLLTHQNLVHIMDEVDQELSMAGAFCVLGLSLADAAKAHQTAARARALSEIERLRREADALEAALSDS